MSTVNKKWSTLFPKSIGNETRSDKPIDNTQAYETDGFPQFMGNDPVRYDLQNAVMTQVMSNDERLNEKINATNGNLVAHNKDTKAHTVGISGNAATATKLETMRDISLTGDAIGKAAFDGSTNISINTTVEQAAHADNATAATNDSDGNAIKTTYLKKADFPKNISAFDNDAKYLQTADLLDKVYPVGSIYLSMVNTDPKNLFGGTWQRISQGRMLLGADDSTYKVGATGGPATETLTVNQIPGHTHTGTTSWADLQGNWGGFSKEANGSGVVVTNSTYNTKIVATGADDSWGKRQHIDVSHNHTFTTNSTGGGQAHNNMSPYLAVYIWQRTA